MKSIVKVPFVDLEAQHKPLEAQLKQALWATIQRGDFVLGQAVREFEQAFAGASGVQYGVGVGCGTDAIALGLQAAGIVPGDEVILPANTFVATLIGVLRVGATPVLVDCDPNTGLMDLVAAAKAITPKSRAVLPVHLYGQMVSPHGLLDLARSYDVMIFEDAAQAHMAEREGFRAGSLGVAAAFSFYPSKNLGGFGDGGMLITQDQELTAIAHSLRNYGASRKYYHTKIGTNSRLDSLQAAVLSAKLPYLSEWNQARYNAAQVYDELLQPLQEYGVVPLTNDSGEGHVYHLYVVKIGESCPLTREEMREALIERGIQTGIHYPIPCHLQPAFRHLGYEVGQFPHAEMLCDEILSLPMYPGITVEQIETVVAAVKQLIVSRLVQPVTR